MGSDHFFWKKKKAENQITMRFFGLNGSRNNRATEKRSDYVYIWKMEWKKSNLYVMYEGEKSKLNPESIRINLLNESKIKCLY